MTTFDERKEGFENKFKHDQEIQFRTLARRNKLLGYWAAELMGFDPIAAKNYAQEIAISDLAKSNDEHIIEKILADFAAKKVECDERRLRKKMAELQGEAASQIRSEA